MPLVSANLPNGHLPLLRGARDFAQRSFVRGDGDVLHREINRPHVTEDVDDFRVREHRKDRRDVAKLLVLLDGSPQARELLRSLASHRDYDRLDELLGAPVFLEIARGNAKKASDLRARAESALDKVRMV